MSKNSGVLKFFGFVMLVVGIIYAIVGTLALIGNLEGVLPGHETQEILVIVLSYAVAIIAFICGIACMTGALKACRVLGMIVALVGLVSLIYVQLTQGTFNIFDCIAMVFGVSICTVASQDKSSKNE